MLAIHFGEFRPGPRGNARVVSFGGLAEIVEGFLALALSLEGERQAFAIRIDCRIPVMLVDQNGAAEWRFGFRVVSRLREEKPQVRCRACDLRAVRSGRAFSFRECRGIKGTRVFGSAGDVNLRRTIVDQCRLQYLD